MQIVTMDEIPDHTVAHVVGVIFSNWDEPTNALEVLGLKADSQGANAVVGLRCHTDLAHGRAMLLYGTAVVVEQLARDEASRPNNLHGIPRSS